MTSEGEKVRFDASRVVVRSDPLSDVVNATVLVPCVDGAVAEVTLTVESPTKLVNDDDTKYDLKVKTVSEVRMPERTPGEGGLRERRDDLQWEIPSRSPAAAVALLDHEKKVKEYMMGNFQEGKVFVDVGANFGGYSVRAAARGMTVYAFEPNPVNLSVLRKNIEINGVTVNVSPTAIGSKPGKARLAPKGDPSGAAPGDGIDVEMRTLDSFGLPGADILRVDVEGYELEVIKGARETLAKFHPLLLVEMHYWAGAQKELELFQLLRELGYTFEYLERSPQGMRLAARAA